MTALTRLTVIAAILLCSRYAADAGDAPNDDKGDAPVPASIFECINVYPYDMLDLVRKGDGFLTSYKPTYVGYSVSTSSKNDGEIKFQISLKYNIGKELFLGYTQKSFWNVKESSAPLKETDYSPEIFYIHNNDDCEFGRDTWLPYQYMLFGFRHESNGLRGADSHGWNMVYIEPFFSMPRYKNLIVAPAVWYPFTSRRNKVLVDDIGIGKLTVKWQHFRFFQVASEFRHGLKGHTYGIEGKVDFFIDQSKNWFSPTIFVQGWKGYGETLATHASNTTRILIGLSLTR